MSMQAALLVYGVLMLALAILVHRECVRRRKGLNPKPAVADGSRLSKWATIGQRTRKSRMTSRLYTDSNFD